MALNYFKAVSISMKNRGEVDFHIGEICHKFGIVLRKEKEGKNCATSFHQNDWMFHCSMMF